MPVKVTHYDNKRTAKKPWYGHQCKKAKRKYNKARYKYTKQPTATNKTTMNLACKVYKKKMIFYMKKYQKDNENKFRKLNKTDPKSYWKLLNRFKHTEKDEQLDINVFYNHFKNINKRDENEYDDNTLFNNLEDEDHMLNRPFTVTEIDKCIKNLKNSKASGSDNMINEFIKSTKHVFLPVYETLFNDILENGIIPKQWIEGVILPIYKQKGDTNNPENYRPITLLSCLGKVFTATLNLRLAYYLETNSILNENQAGFRNNYSTSDHCITLSLIIDLLRHHKKKIFTTFIDFSKAFDSVWRIGLFNKIIKNGVNGKFLKVIFSMYTNIKSCIKVKNDFSPYFLCENGVRQGENLSPILFSIYLNDLESFLYTNSCNGINLENYTQQVNVYLKLIILLYADDTVLICDSEKEMQTCLDTFSQYCNTWKLNINTSKTKVMVLGAKHKKYKLKINGHEIEQVNTYKYLGTVFAKSGSFLHARKHTVQQAQKALYLLYSRIYNLNLPIDLQLQLFDSTILPILTLGCETWGYEDTTILERINLSFLKEY